MICVSCRTKNKHVRFTEEDSPIEEKIGRKEQGQGTLNVLYKVESKDIPMLQANKALKGQIFDDWYQIFYAKMSQAQVSELMDETFVKPRVTDPGYKEFKTKADYLKNHILMR